MSVKHKHKTKRTSNMQNRSNDNTRSELERLTDLMAVATRLVEGQLHQFGHTLIVLTTSTTTKATRLVAGDASCDPDALATSFRLSCIAEAAQVGVVTYQVRGEQVDGIVVAGEALGGIFCNWFHPILRDAGGRFTGFGPKQVLPPAPPESPFSRIMPACAPSAQEREAAAGELAAMTTPITASSPHNEHETQGQSGISTGAPGEQT
jgi:hypothetical protein